MLSFYSAPQLLYLKPAFDIKINILKIISQNVIQQACISSTILQKKNKSKSLKRKLGKAMGSMPGKHNIQQPSQMEAAEAALFNQEVKKMKYDKSKAVFRQKSDQTQQALSRALGNLRSKKLIDTNEFKSLKNSVPNKSRLKTQKTELLKKMYFGSAQNPIRLRNNSDQKLLRYPEASLNESSVLKSKNRRSVKY